jgi:transmembrane sensor
MNSNQKRQSQIDDAAAAWLVRLSAHDITEKDWSSFHQWIAEHPDHESAFTTAKATLGLMDAAFKNDVAAQNTTPAKPVARNDNKPVWHRYFAIAACLLIALFAGRFWFGAPELWMADYKTAPGETRTIQLDDGSQVILGPDSAIDVDYSATQRNIVLLSGLADFSAKPVDPAEKRPFVVKADHGRTQALGTRFVVERIDDSVNVSALVHNIVIHLDNQSDTHKGAILSPGQSLRYRQNNIGEITSIQPDRVLAWQNGRIIFDNVPLSQVVAKLNRYRRGKVVIADDTLAKRRVSGVFQTADTTRGLATIVHELGIGSISTPPFLTVLY